MKKQNKIKIAGFDYVIDNGFVGTTTFARIRPNKQGDNPGKYEIYAEAGYGIPNPRKHVKEQAKHLHT